jgi:hypothetical protein
VSICSLCEEHISLIGALNGNVLPHHVDAAVFCTESAHHSLLGQFIVTVVACGTLSLLKLSLRRICAGAGYRLSLPWKFACPKKHVKLTSTVDFSDILAALHRSGAIVAGVTVAMVASACSPARITSSLYVCMKGGADGKILCVGARIVSKSPKNRRNDEMYQTLALVLTARDSRICVGYGPLPSLQVAVTILAFSLPRWNSVWFVSLLIPCTSLSSRCQLYQYWQQ